MKHNASTSAVIVVAEDSNVQTAYNAPRSPFDEKRGGMGLALPLARRVIERHGGRVWSPAGDPETAEVKRAVIVDVPLTEKSR
jgi:signal transduction histidine kinase